MVNVLATPLVLSLNPCPTLITMCAHIQVLEWFTRHEAENGLPVCRIKNKFAFSRDELVREMEG